MKLEEVLPIERATGRRILFKDAVCGEDAIFYFRFRYEDLLSDDWGLESKVITITEEQFDAAARRTNKFWCVMSPREQCDTAWGIILKKELGFK